VIFTGEGTAIGADLSARLAASVLFAPEALPLATIEEAWAARGLTHKPHGVLAELRFPPLPPLPPPSPSATSDAACEPHEEIKVSEPAGALRLPPSYGDGVDVGSETAKKLVVRRPRTTHRSAGPYERGFPHASSASPRTCPSPIATHASPPASPQSAAVYLEGGGRPASITKALLREARPWAENVRCLVAPTDLANPFLDRPSEPSARRDPPRPPSQRRERSKSLLAYCVNVSGPSLHGWCTGALGNDEAP
jgi:hypothetical protein